MFALLFKLLLELLIYGLFELLGPFFIYKTTMKYI